MDNMKPTTEVVGPESHPASEYHGMQNWDERQNAAWLMFGATSVTLAMYWLQYYYYHFWFVTAGEYAASTSDRLRSNTYSMWGLSENINAYGMMFQWVPTALFWVLTGATNDDDVIWFFVIWCGIMHYVDVVRFVLVNVVKVVAFFYDSETMVNSYSGLEQTYKVSKDHQLQYWDFAMEWFGFLVSYTLYLDLHTIVEDQEHRIIEAEEEMLDY